MDLWVAYTRQGCSGELPVAARDAPKERAAAKDAGGFPAT